MAKPANKYRLGLVAHSLIFCWQSPLAFLWVQCPLIQKAPAPPKAQFWWQFSSKHSKYAQQRKLHIWSIWSCQLRAIAMASPSAAHSRAVQEVLGASDHYTVLAATRELDEASLRRCYLKRSVAVHPDKNPHELATTGKQSHSPVGSRYSRYSSFRTFKRPPSSPVSHNSNW